MTAKTEVLKCASYLLDPACKVREYYYSFNTLDKICSTTAEKVAQAALLVLGIAACAVLSLVTAPCGLLLRGMVALASSDPYIYWQGAEVGSTWGGQTLEIASHNVCWMVGGYSITDGTILPPAHPRMDAEIAALRALAADVLCLFEVPDICDAKYLAERLPEHPFVVPVAGFRAVGPSSMIFVASRYELGSVEFVPFIKGEELTGRAKNSEKGVLLCDLKETDVTILSTHLQHSEIPDQPTGEEVRSRKAQLQKICDLVRKKEAEGKNVVITGDFNLNEEELTQFWVQHPVKWKRDLTVRGMPTWGGDAWCKRLMGEPVSQEQVLDYTFATGRRVEAVKTEVIDVGYNAEEFRPDALSDHKILKSTIHFSL